jgi:cytidylate kinase
MMAANVVTFSVQLGSDGFAIAQTVAEKLGYRYLDNEVIAQAAAMAGVSPETVAAAERWPTFVERMLERLALTTVVSEGVLPTPPANPATMMLTSADYRQLIEQVVESLAENGHCVIVGHAGQAILRNTPHVFKVLVHGTRQRRAERLAGEQGIEVKDALNQVKDSDRQREDFFKHVYNLEWLDSSTYDMTINTDDVETATAVALILTGVEAVPSAAV